MSIPPAVGGGTPALCSRSRLPEPVRRRVVLGLPGWARRTRAPTALLRIAGTRGRQAVTVREVAAEAGGSLHVVPYYVTDYYVTDKAILPTAGPPPRWCCCSR